MKFVVKRARRGVLRRNQWVATIVAGNGKSLFQSETYNNFDDATQACMRVQEQAPDAEIVWGKEELGK